MPKIVDHDEYRKEILLKCFTLFSRKGYASVTMREIAFEVGVSTGTLYHYFPTKENIMIEMFMLVQVTNVDAFLSLTEEHESIEKKLDIFVERWKEFGSFYQRVMLLAVDVKRNLPEKVSEEIFINFSNYYTQAMAKELGISEEGARSLFVYLLGMIFHSLATPKFMSFDSQVDDLRDKLERLIYIESGSKEYVKK